MLSLSIWVSSCSNETVYTKPDGALTLPMDFEVRTEADTTRTLLKKFEFNLKQILDGNFRFENIRE